MTLLNALPRPAFAAAHLVPAHRPSAPISQRISAAFHLGPAARRYAALALLRELIALGAPTEHTLRSWSQIGYLLTRCAVSCDDEERAAHFSQLARNSHDLWEAALEEVSARRSARRRPPVIEAAYTEVRP